MNHENGQHALGKVSMRDLKRFKKGGFHQEYNVVQISLNSYSSVKISP